MNQTAAYIVDGKVNNIVVWDSSQPTDQGDGSEIVFLPTYVDENGKERVVAGIGWDYIDGEFVDNRTKPEKEPKDEAIRSKRDALLSQSDWTQVPDAPVDQAAWAEYRQALRDLPQQAGFPTEITWPVKPE